MAGRGLRTDGYSVPKPLIPINGKTMVERAVQSLGIPGQYIFVRRIYDNDEWNQQLFEALYRAVEHYGRPPVVLNLTYVTEGPACSALIAKEYINNESPLVLTNCDQILKWDAERFIRHSAFSTADGIVVTYNADTLKNSYVELDSYGRAIRFAEKEVISEHSLNGIHYWRQGKFFVETAEQMIEKDIRVNNEFYVSLTYNELIEMGGEVTIHHIPADQHWAVGTENDIARYEERFTDEDTQAE